METKPRELGADCHNISFLTFLKNFCSFFHWEVEFTFSFLESGWDSNEQSHLWANGHEAHVIKLLKCGYCNQRTEIIILFNSTSFKLKNWSRRKYFTNNLIVWIGTVPINYWKFCIWKKTLVFGLRCVISPKSKLGTPLVVQRLGICLPMQGTWVPSLVQEDSTCHRATKLAHHNYWSLHA